MITEASRILDAAKEEIQTVWIAEAQRRLAAIERGESTPVALEDMMLRLRTKVRRSSQASAG